MNRHRIDATSLGDLLLKAADRWPDNDAVVFSEARHTYRSLTDRAYDMARALVGLGVRPGEHVGILMPNCMAYVELILGCALAGIVSVPINARFKAHEMGYVIENADLVALFTSDIISEYADFAAVLTDAFPDLPRQSDVTALALAGAPRLRTVVMHGGAAPAGFMGMEAFEALKDRATVDAVDARRVAVSLREPCMMMYTSGTTANPKGCPISHENLVRNGINMNREKYALVPGDRLWDPLPLFHMSAILPLTALFDAGAAMLSMSHFEASEALRMIEEEGATVLFPAFPTIMAALINHPDFGARNMSRVRRINNVAPPDTMRQFQAAFPQAIQTAAYGLTEVGGVIAFGHPDDSEHHRSHACGTTFPGIQVRVIDPETGDEVPTGAKGEMTIRGYAVFDGYYKDAGKTADTLRGGWLHTGDLCAVDEHGQIFFHGRLKDMLKVGGENVGAVEIESFLSNHPAVKLAQVVGVPDARLLEVPAAFIELKPGAQASEQEIIEFCKGRIASFKVPRHVRFINDWPMSSTKIQKFRLREDFVAAQAAARS
ncbi:AMP-binding protein [Iodidimonas sp. SYSU 1G8]|uniref:class I adenylate-forming enzyme family protein n=1 Tax=Iodidimonas sp. SYSU 1G8 TaxID=3133967 RepID=UPI0031FF1AF8